MTPIYKNTVTAIKLLIATTIVAIIGYCGFMFYPPFALVAHILVGQDPVCSFVAAVTTYSDSKRVHQQTMNRIAKTIQFLPAGQNGFFRCLTPRNEYLIPAGAKDLLAHLLAEQERGVYGSGDTGVRPGDIVLDCGAHIGVYTRKALDSGAKLVVAIEPAPENVQCLRWNFASEIAQGRVVVCPKGVWDREDLLSFRVNPENSASDSFFAVWPDAVEIGRIPLSTIDHIVGELRLDHVDFIKMDIEGAEQRALRGAVATLRRHRPRLAIAAYHLPDDPEQLPATVRAAVPGYARECGPYTALVGGIIPEVLYFRVPQLVAVTNE